MFSRKFALLPTRHFLFSTTEKIFELLLCAYNTTFHPLLLSLFRVPLGFVCGYPLQGGELYGGSMFIKSAAHDTLQGRAIQAVNEKWGEDFRKWGGRETIGIPVCKKKYSPFCFKVIEHKDENLENNGNIQQKRRRPKLEVTVERMYGCKCHSDIRKTVIEQRGVRQGWEPFGQWSLKKAQELAKKETERLNSPQSKVLKTTPAVAISTNQASDGETTSEEDDSSSDDDRRTAFLPTMCHNGMCTWKVRAKYDNVYREIRGHTESDEEQ